METQWRTRGRKNQGLLGTFLAPAEPGFYKGAGACDFGKFRKVARGGVELVRRTKRLLGPKTQKSGCAIPIKTQGRSGVWNYWRINDQLFSEKRRCMLQGMGLTHGERRWRGIVAANPNRFTGCAERDLVNSKKWKNRPLRRPCFFVGGARSSNQKPGVFWGGDFSEHGLRK